MIEGFLTAMAQDTLWIKTVILLTGQLYFNLMTYQWDQVIWGAR